MLALNELPPIAFSNQVLLIEKSVYLMSRRRLDKSRATKSSVKVAPSERRRGKMKLREESRQGGQGKMSRLFFLMASIFSGCPDLKGLFFSPGLLLSHFQLVMHSQCGYICLGGTSLCC